MPWIARASNTVRNKNILIILMCAGFTAWFAFDGYIGWPEKNDSLLERTKELATKGELIDDKTLAEIQHWPAYSKADAATRERMDQVMKELGPRYNENWKTSFDINLQRWIVMGLALATGVSVWWFIHCQRRRAMADEATVSPAPGVVVPWEQIKLVDNTRWNSHGIVEIVFPGADGTEQRAKFDDYELDRNALLAILDQLSLRAVNAEFIPKEEEGKEGEPTGSEPAPPSAPAV